MGGYNNFPGPQGGIKVGVIGNMSDDMPQDQSSNQKILNPLEHGSGVDLQHLAFSTLSQAPTQFGQQSFAGALDPGTIVYYLAQEGLPGGIILGQSNSQLGGNQEGGSSGGQSLTQGKVSQLRKSKWEVNVAPDIEEGEERGAKIRKIKEKGKQHSLSELDGLPSHGALFDLAGFRLPEMKKIPTAKKHGSKMMDKDMMNQLLGQVQSMGGMLKGLMGKGGGGKQSGLTGLVNMSTANNTPTMGTRTLGNNTIYLSYANVGNVKVSNTAIGNIYFGLGSAGWGNTGNNRIAHIVANLNPNMKMAMNSYANLVQGFVTSNGTAFVYGDIVHPPSVLANAEILLSQANNLSDFTYAIKELQSNTKYFGLNKISNTNVTIVVETAWGLAKKVLMANGDVYLQYSNTAKNNIIAFEKTLANTTLAAGFTSVPANTIMVKTTVYRTTREEANTDVEYAVFASNVNAAVQATTTSPLNPTAAGAGGSGGGSGGGGGGTGQNIMGQMFGKSSQVMQDLMKRLPMTGEKESKQMTEKLNSDQTAQKLMQIAKKTINGGDPLTKSLFE